jgi:tRNA threonylcarbamoyladenosine biosynthesis protein TsaB
MELAIDSSTRYASVALSLDGQVLQEATWRAGQNHSVELAPAVQRLLEAAHATPADLKAVFVAKGPGGFSALRVGMSFAKSLAVALKVPLVTVGTLDIEAAPYRELGLPVWAVLDAGRARWYAAHYTAGYATSAFEGVAYRVLTTDELAAEVRAPALLCGENAAQAAEVLREAYMRRNHPSLPPRGGKVRMGVSGAPSDPSPPPQSSPLKGEEVVPQGLVVAPGEPPTRRAGTLARLAHARLSRGDVDDPVAAQPLYLRGSQYEVAAGSRQRNEIS